MPPQSNNMYCQTRQGRRFPSKELLEFKSLFGGHLDFEIGKTIEQWKAMVAENTSLHIDRVFAFRRCQVVSKPRGKKEGTLKKMDVTNRIKALDDCVALLISVDDSLFNSGSEVKAISSNDKPFCIVRLRWIQDPPVVSF
jgi:hypothetical protein